MTHIIDLSTNYGSSDLVSNSLRTFVNGQFKSSEGNLLPAMETCASPPCYYICMYNLIKIHNLMLFINFMTTLVENRGLFFPLVKMIQVAYYRLHNKIAEQLSQLNSYWDDDKIFQETRRIIIAIHQNIIYNQLLPIYLGRYISFNEDYNCPKY